MRITGLASGMDVDGMVSELMKARRTSLDTLVQKRTTVEWQQEAYRSISTKIVDFRNNKLSSYNLSNSIGAKKAEVSGNTSSIAINSAASSAAGTLDVKVNKIATTANTVFTYNAGGSTKDKTLEQLGFNVSDGNRQLTFVVPNEQGGTTSVSVAYSATDKLSDLVKKINANKNTNATAIYNETTGQFSISNTKTGAGDVPVTGIPTSFTAVKTAGNDAEVEINGIVYTQKSNQFNVNGIDFTAKAVSGTNGNSKVTVATDTDKIVNTIKSFISDYNSLIETINSKLSEEKYRGYTPLTDAQKEDMKESQITLWEDKAHSGLLKNDSILSKLTSDLRIASTAAVGGLDIQSLGIETGEWFDKGKLVLKDESKLRAAIEGDPDKVIALFTQTSIDKSPSSSTTGIFAKMTDSTLEALKMLSTKAGISTSSTDINSTFMANSLLSTQIASMKDSESSMAARLSIIEDQYYKQFSAMETAINKLNSQSSSLSSFM